MVDEKNQIRDQYNLMVGMFELNSDINYIWVDQFGQIAIQTNKTKSIDGSELYEIISVNFGYSSVQEELILAISAANFLVDKDKNKHIEATFRVRVGARFDPSYKSRLSLNLKELSMPDDTDNAYMIRGLDIVKRAAALISFYKQSKFKESQFENILNHYISYERKRSIDDARESLQSVLNPETDTEALLESLKSYSAIDVISPDLVADILDLLSQSN